MVDPAEIKPRALQSLCPPTLKFKPVREILELDDVVALLRQEVEKAGGQTVWSKKTDTNRTLLNRVLRGRRPPTPE